MSQQQKDEMTAQSYERWRVSAVTHLQLQVRRDARKALLQRQQVTQSFSLSDGAEVPIRTDIEDLNTVNWVTQKPTEHHLGREFSSLTQHKSRLMYDVSFCLISLLKWGTSVRNSCLGGMSRWMTADYSKAGNLLFVQLYSAAVTHTRFGYIIAYLWT